MFCVPRRKSRAGHGGTEVHAAAGHGHLEVDTTPVVLRTIQLPAAQHQLRRRRHTRGPGSDRKDHVRVDRPGDRVRPEPVPERRRVRATAQRRRRWVPMPLRRSVRRRRLCRPGSNQRCSLFFSSQTARVDDVVSVTAGSFFRVFF